MSQHKRVNRGPAVQRGFAVGGSGRGPVSRKGFAGHPMPEPSPEPASVPAETEVVEPAEETPEEEAPSIESHWRSQRLRERMPVTLDDIGGVFNKERFSMGPAPEVVLNWWDHSVSYMVRRERSGHRVLVLEELKVEWNWHIGISAGAAVLLLVGSLIAGLPILYALLLSVLLGLVVMGLILYERRLSGDKLDRMYRETDKIDGRTVLVLDEPIWEDIKSHIGEFYDEKVHANTAREQRRFGGPSWLQRFRPLPGAAMNDVLAEMHEQLDPNRLERYHRTVQGTYRKDSRAALALGTGTRECQCRACAVIEQEGWADQPREPGAVAALKRSGYRVAVGTPVPRETPAMAQISKTRAQEKLAAHEKRRQQQQARDKERERARSAQEYVAKRRRDNEAQRRARGSRPRR